METYDAIVVGGGPAGSTCARSLVRGGLRVAVLDAARFPRVKLCAGWVSPPVWEALELAPADYPRGLWPWERVFVHFGGRAHPVSCRGAFIRRFEFDDFLLRRSGAEARLGHRVRRIERGGGFFAIDGALRAPLLVGAGGTNCPVARALFPERTGAPVTTQEREFEGDPGEIAAARIGRDGECELLLHEDLRGYSWNAPKGGWVNVGAGTNRPRAVLPAWREARAFFERSGHLPATARPLLDEVKGHSYYLFAAERVARAGADGAFLVGDALGLAHPVTGEGIYPAILSGRRCAEAILAGDRAGYPGRLAREPVFADYAVLARLVAWSAPRAGEAPAPRVVAARGPRLLDGLVARVFGSLFSGKPLAGRRALALLAGGLERAGRLRTWARRGRG
jgi:flavin-dependent dehydrogenase